MLNIAFVLSGPGLSGGVNVILNHVFNMINYGLKVGIVSREKIEANDIKWHPIFNIYYHPNLYWLDFKSVSRFDFDIAIATWWRTYFDLWKISANNYAYFVQSIESRFYNDNEMLIKNSVDSTYDIPVGFITEAQWIKNYIQKVHGFPCELVPNGIDKNIFKPLGPSLEPREKNKTRVLVEGPIDVWFKKVPEAIRLAIESGSDELWLLTSSKIDSYPFVDRVFSQIPQQNLGEIYRSCDVLLKLSYVEGMFGPPLEMFHCGGTCIIYSVTGHEEYIINGYNGIIVPRGNENKVRKALIQLLKNKEFLLSLQKNALLTADKWPDWFISTQNFINAINIISSRGTVPRDTLRRHCLRVWKFVEYFWQSMSERDQEIAYLKKVLKDNSLLHL